MSTEATATGGASTTMGGKAHASPSEKEKGKTKVAQSDVDDDDDDDDDEEEEGAEDEEDDEEMEDEPDLKPENILSRRTRGKKIDYTSPEALQKAGLKPEEEDDEEDEFRGEQMEE